MPKKFSPDRQGTAKLSLTLTDATAGTIRELAEAKGLTLAQVVRSALGLYTFVDGLDDNEELCVRNLDTDEITRLAIVQV